MAKFRVTAPMVYLKVRDLAGAVVLRDFYAGAVVEAVDPDDPDYQAGRVDPASIEHHLDGGMLVEEDDPVAPLLAVPAGTPVPGEPPNVPVTEATPSPVDAGARLETVRESAGLKKPQPSRAASKQAWVDYARQEKGASPEDVEGLGKDELIARYGDAQQPE